MILKVHVPGAHCYEVGDEIWHVPLPDAIRAEAEIVAEDAASDLLEPHEQSDREALRDRVIAEMTATLIEVGDTYAAPDGVLYSLSEESAVDVRPREGKLGPVNDPASRPIVEEVVRFEDLPLGSLGTRRAVVRWSDGTESEAINWYADEFVRHEAPYDRAEMKGLRRGPVAAGSGRWGQPDLGDAREGGSSPDNDGTGWHCQTAWVRQSRREGVTRVNQWQSSVSGVPAQTWRNGSVSSARPPSRSWWATPQAGGNRRPGGHGEGLRRSHGEAAGA